MSNYTLTLTATAQNPPESRGSTWLYMPVVRAEATNVQNGFVAGRVIDTITPVPTNWVYVPVTELQGEVTLNTENNIVKLVPKTAASTAIPKTPLSNTPLSNTFTPAPSTTPSGIPTTPLSDPASTRAKPPPTSTRKSSPTGSLSPQPATEAQSNTGPVVGAAIGCLIAGAIIGFIIAFFIYKKRSQREPYYASPPTVVESKAFDAPPPAAVVEDKLSRFLLDASPDKEIASELRSLGTLIQQHVENNYHLQPVQADPRALAVSLTQLGVTSSGSLSPDMVAKLALDPRTRQVALQHVISQVLFTSIDVNSRSRLSMFPAPIAAFLQSIPPLETGEKNNEVLSTALNQWRALSAFILHPSRSQRTPLPISNAAVSPQALGLADALDTFLGYFVDENNRFQQKSHLQAVITECTKFGYILLSQPNEWRLVDDAGTAHHSGPHGYSAVVCAGLVKVALRDGTPTSSPQQVVAPTTVMI